MEPMKWIYFWISVTHITLSVSNQHNDKVAKENVSGKKGIGTNRMCKRSSLESLHTLDGMTGFIPIVLLKKKNQIF